jgi:predicted transcriptional regulator
LDQVDIADGNGSERIDFDVVANNIRCQRMALDKTQADLAAMAGDGRSTIRRLEGATTSSG